MSIRWIGILALLTVAHGLLIPPTCNAAEEDACVRFDGPPLTTCGPEAIGLYLASRGHPVSEKEIVAVTSFRPESGGMTLEGIVQTLAHFGGKNSVQRISPAHLTRLGKPCIAFLDFGHACLVQASRKGNIWVKEAGRKPQLVAPGEFAKVWSGIVVAPDVRSLGRYLLSALAGCLCILLLSSVAFPLRAPKSKDPTRENGAKEV